MARWSITEQLGAERHIEKTTVEQIKRRHRRCYIALWSAKSVCGKSYILHKIEIDKAQAAAAIPLGAEMIDIGHFDVIDNVQIF